MPKCLHLDVSLTLLQLGHFVAQLRLIFVPVFSDKRTHPILAYIQPLLPHPKSVMTRASESNPRVTEKVHITVKDIDMFRVIRSLRPDKSRRGAIIELSDIWRPIQLVPVFEGACPADWTCDSAVESADSLYVNSFSEKPVYQSVY